MNRGDAHQPIRLKGRHPLDGLARRWGIARRRVTPAITFSGKLPELRLPGSSSDIYNSGCRNRRRPPGGGEVLTAAGRLGQGADGCIRVSGFSGSGVRSATVRFSWRLGRGLQRFTKPLSSGWVSSIACTGSIRTVCFRRIATTPSSNNLRTADTLKYLVFRLKSIVKWCRECVIDWLTGGVLVGQLVDWLFFWDTFLMLLFS